MHMVHAFFGLLLASFTHFLQGDIIGNSLGESYGSNKNWCNNQYKTKPCIYFIGYTVTVTEKQALYHCVEQSMDVMFCIKAMNCNIIYSKYSVNSSCWILFRKCLYLHFVSVPKIEMAQVVEIIRYRWPRYFIQHRQCHACWWPGNSRLQGISN